MDGFYQSKPWRKIRIKILIRDNYRCRMCGTLLITGRKSKRSAVIDHTIPRELAPERALDESNLKAVCKHCHDVECQAIEKRHKHDAPAIAHAKNTYRTIGLDGYPVDRLG